MGYLLSLHFEGFKRSLRQGYAEEVTSTVTEDDFSVFGIFTHNVNESLRA